MINKRNFFSKTLIVTVTLATLLSTFPQAQSVQAATNKGKGGKVTTDQTLTEDQKAAAAVDTLVATLPKVNKLTLNDETAVTAANTAYNALTDTQKTLVKSSTKTTLTAAVNKITELKNAKSALTENQNAAAAVDALIVALPAVDKITAVDATAINEAYTAFTALTKAQKALLKPSNSGKITAAYNKLKSLTKSITKALSDLNGGKKSFANFAKAGVIGAIEENKNAYFTSIAQAKKEKGSALTLEEIQAIVDTVNKTTTQDESASTALAAINAGTEVFADFATAGVTGALEANKASYDTQLATAKTTKGSDLTLAEVQAIVDTVNTAVTQSNNAATALAAINAGTEVFADFATAGVTGAVEANKASYDTQLATAKTTKGSDLTLVEVQAVVDTVNQTVVEGTTV